jgi:hypothetical protein
MVLNIYFENYRTFKNEVVFSLVAEASKTKKDNVFTAAIGKGDEVRLLKTAAIYGANASGKSTLLKGLFEIQKMLNNDNKREVGDAITAYEPFLFAAETNAAPVKFIIEFVTEDDENRKVKFKYEILFDNKNILFELLEYYPNNVPKQLLKREIGTDSSAITHYGFIGNNSKNKKEKLFHNQPFLSKFASDIPDEIISKVYIYLKGIKIINATNSKMLSPYNKRIRERINTDNIFFNKINDLLKHSDFGINNIASNQMPFDDDELTVSNNLSKNLNRKIIENLKNNYDLKTYHDFYKDGKLIHKTSELNFKEESTGTKTVLILGGVLLETLEKGGIIFVDELDTSLHTYLAKLLVMLFQNKKVNNKNAQLVFISHDTNLLDRTLLRKDQIWFTEKDEQGVTELISLQDFTDVRQDTPYEKWYLAGKFGALPNLKSIEKFYSI